jgi:hypothetical protein
MAEQNRSTPPPARGRARIDSAPGTRKERQILGISLTPEVAQAFKAEAARKGVSPNKLFMELWQDYLKAVR